jgi:hypothetical protein
VNNLKTTVKKLRHASAKYPEFGSIRPIVQKPDTLIAFGQFSRIYHKYFNNKHLIPAMDGQYTLSDTCQSTGFSAD